jgi:hypothetical protein
MRRSRTVMMAFITLILSGTLLATTLSRLGGTLRGPRINLERIGSTPFEGSAAAEIAAYDPISMRLFSTNVAASSIDIFDLSNPRSPVLISTIALGGIPNSVAVRDGLFAVATENPIKTEPGWVKFFNVNGALLSSVTVGAVPDMVTFTPNGRRVLVANEGEPNDAYTLDPEGSVSIIDLTRGVINLPQRAVRTVDFRFFNSAPIDPNIRIFGPNATVATNLEPEYITVSHDSKTAWVTLQENNAIAILDIEAGVFTRLIALGFKDHSQPSNALDPSDRDNADGSAGAITIGNWPVFGMYQPDGIDSYRVGGETYLVTANEGDTRDWTGYSELQRVSTLTLDSAVFPNSIFLQMNQNLGRLNVTNATGNLDADSQFERLYSFGGRSFSIWTAAAELVFDSGDDFERITAASIPPSFNSNGTSNTFDTRSDDKGPEPEGVVLAKLFGRTYAFICLERTGGIIIYDVSNPRAPSYVRYVNTAIQFGDISPEAPFFVNAEDSPTGKALLIVPHEVSGNIVIFEITR